MEKKANKKEPNELAKYLTEFYAEDLRRLLAFRANIYPLRTLKRRLALLNKKEAQRVIDKFNRVTHILDYEIDAIISERAEREGDRWP